jgi:hypothetical protein
MLIVDAANVVGSRPDGWWKDRPGAAARLVERVTRAVDTGALEEPVTIVLEGSARSGAPTTTGPVCVVHAPASGDDAVVELVRAHGGTVVTADRALRERVRTAGGTSVGPSWLLERLPDPPGTTRTTGRGPQT